MPDLLNLLPERYRRAAGRLMRRRLARYDRGLPMDLTQPVDADAMTAPPLPAETVAEGPRPIGAVAASAILTIMAGVTAAGAVVDLGRPFIGLVNEPAVDGMTKLVQLIIAGFVGAILVALLVLAALHAYAAWRIWQGINWGWIEGLVISVIGALFAVLSFGLTDAGTFAFSVPLALALGAYAAAIMSILAARSWLGEVRFPMNPEHAPWWLRRWGA